jgi:hypothetical protein
MDTRISWMRLKWQGKWRTVPELNVCTFVLNFRSMFPGNCRPAAGGKHWQVALSIKQE